MEPRLDPDLEREQYRRDEVRARRGPGIGGILEGIASALLTTILVVVAAIVLLILLLVWIF